MRPERRPRPRRRVWLALLVLESCFFSGPFLLPLLQTAWCESHGEPVPARFPYVAWLLCAGVLLAGWLVYDSALRLRRRFARSS